MNYVLAAAILYGAFFLLCYLGTGGDEKNMKSFYSYPDAVQEKLRQNPALYGMPPAKPSALKSFMANLVLFTAVFLILWAALGRAGFVRAFLYLLLVGQGLNLFDLLVIDACWWRRSGRTRFTGIAEGTLYCGMGKHLAAFWRAVPMFACAALLAAGAGSAILSVIAP